MVGFWVWAFKVRGGLLDGNGPYEYNTLLHMHLYMQTHRILAAYKVLRSTPKDLTLTNISPKPTALSPKP